MNEAVSVDFLAAAVRFLTKRDGPRVWRAGDEGMNNLIRALAAAEEAWAGLPAPADAGVKLAGGGGSTGGGQGDGAGGPPRGGDGVDLPQGRPGAAGGVAAGG